MNDTLTYYNKNAEAFISTTVGVDFSQTQERFREKLSPGAFILDFGCGSGRDTKYFADAGFRVEAVDGSEELCRLASEYTGQPVRHMLFQDLNETEKYDGIWACASILHLPHDELKSVLRKMVRAVRKGGVIYTSFKYGDYEGERNGRFFIDFTEESFKAFIKDITNITINELWLTGDVRPDRENEKWLNLIMRKAEGQRV